jgi:hypothetical protein
MKVAVHLYSQSSPVEHDGVLNTYQKGDLYCVLRKDMVVHKYPIQHIFRVVEFPRD